MRWPWGDAGDSSTGFVWGVSADERLLKSAEKAGRRDAKHHPPDDHVWPDYLKTLLHDVATQTGRYADAFADEFAVPRQTAENCLESEDSKDKPALKQAIHAMVDLLEDFDRKLLASHRVRQSMQSRYQKGLTDGLGYDSWTPPRTVLEDPVAGQRKQLQRLASRANRKINPSTGENYLSEDDPFPEPNTICDWQRVIDALNETMTGSSDSTNQGGGGDTHV